MSNTRYLAEIIEQAPDLEWLDRAACSRLDIDQLELFFVEAGRSLSAEAAQLCRGCSARQDCLRHAYDRGIVGGYFGGLSPSKRRQLDLDAALAVVEADSAC